MALTLGGVSPDEFMSRLEYAHPTAPRPGRTHYMDEPDTPLAGEKVEPEHQDGGHVGSGTS